LELRSSHLEKQIIDQEKKLSEATVRILRLKKELEEALTDRCSKKPHARRKEDKFCAFASLRGEIEQQIFKLQETGQVLL
jgi:hypothetical protein